MEITNLIEQISKKLPYKEESIQKTITLFEEGKTIPFIARYRKEQTGNLNEVQIQEILEMYNYLVELEKRKETIIRQLKKLNIWNSQKEEILKNIQTKEELEDFYEPYKPERKTLAQKYIELGLKPYAEKVKSGQNITFSDYKDNKIKKEEDFYTGIVVILADMVYLDLNVKNYFRKIVYKNGYLKSKVKKGKKDIIKYDKYFDFSKNINYLKAYEIHALLRAEKEKVINLSLEINKEWAGNFIRKTFFRYKTNELIEQAIKRAVDNLILPYFLTEIKKYLKNKADLFSIEVYKKNVIDLLMLPPHNFRVVLGIDPGIRTGHKYVIIEDFYQLKSYGVIKNNELKTVKDLIKKFNVEAIIVGNGTGGHELFGKLYESDLNVYYVSEDGASIYSASEKAREEFEQLDLTYRGAISITRRFLDPVNEYIKIPIQALGVGEYQYDINKKLLEEKLKEAIYFTVNQIGIDLNMATKELLSYVSGFNGTIAQKIVEYRNKNGFFKHKKELLNVKGIGKRVFEQAEGFLRVKNGEYPIENSGIIEEQYPIIKRLEILEGRDINSILISRTVEKKNIDILKDEFTEQTVNFIYESVINYDKDPRIKPSYEEFIPTIKSEDELKEGRRIKSRIKNITSFGMFCDSGVHKDIFIPGNYLEKKYFVGQIIEILIDKISKKGISGSIYQ